MATAILVSVVSLIFLLVGFALGHSVKTNTSPTERIIEVIKEVGEALPKKPPKEEEEPGFYDR
jgi:hypothetical protein